MAIVTIPGTFIRTLEDYAGSSSFGPFNGTGHKLFAIGRVVLASGAGSSKTFSSAGGKVILGLNSVTFANVGTTVRVGVQDVNTGTGLADSTFDTYADLVGGGGGLTTGYCLVTMASGTKTITHGDLIAIGLEFISRAGSDSFSGQTMASNTTKFFGFPYGHSNTAGDVRVQSTLLSSLVMDDGTAGWIIPMSVIPVIAHSTFSINVSSSPDEYCAVFTPVAPMQIDKIGMQLVNINSSDAFDWELHSDPLGTPVSIETAAANPFLFGGNIANRLEWWQDITPVTLAAGTTYGFSIRPTAANTIGISYVAPGSGRESLKAPTFFGSTLKLASRTGPSGAFTETDTTHIPSLMFRISGIDDGTGGGGGGETVSVIG
jgi:hypothetical protein